MARMQFKKQASHAPGGERLVKAGARASFGPFDVHLQQVDAFDAGFVKDIVEGPGRDFEPPAIFDDGCGARQTKIAKSSAADSYSCIASIPGASLAAISWTVTSSS